MWSLCFNVEMDVRILRYPRRVGMKGSKSFWKGYGKLVAKSSSRVLPWPMWQVGTFFLTFVYEFVPQSLGGLICWLVEGHTSAWNRELLYSKGRHVRGARCRSE